MVTFGFFLNVSSSAGVGEVCSEERGIRSAFFYPYVNPGWIARNSDSFMSKNQKAQPFLFKTDLHRLQNVVISLNRSRPFKSLIKQLGVLQCGIPCV